MSTLLSFIVFVMAGNDATTRVQNGIAGLSRGRVQPRPAAKAGEPTFNPTMMTGWAILFLMLVAAADVPTTAPLAAGFGWLIFIAILLAFGGDAFDNISKVALGPTTQAGGGGTPPKAL
jgi:hypothetical protein